MAKPSMRAGSLAIIHTRCLLIAFVLRILHVVDGGRNAAKAGRTRRRAAVRGRDRYANKTVAKWG